MSGVQEQQASKLKRDNPLDKVKDALSSGNKSGPANVKSDDIGFKPTDPNGKDGRAVSENDAKSVGDTTSLPTITGASAHPAN